MAIGRKNRHAFWIGTIGVGLLAVRGGIHVRHGLPCARKVFSGLGVRRVGKHA
jgi:hypothetical protein